MNPTHAASLLRATLLKRGPGAFVNLCLSWFTLKAEPLRVATMPLYLQAEPTTRCNLHCPMCYGSYPRRMCDDLTLDGFRRMLAQFPGLIKVHLQGLGEPLINADIFDMVRHARARGVMTELTTNATLLDRTVGAEILASGLDYIEFSVDSPDAATFEAMRPGAGLAAVEANIRAFVAERGRVPKPGMKLVAVLGDENVDQTADLVRYARTLGIYSVYFIQVQPWRVNRTKAAGDEDPVFTRRLQASLRAARATARRLGVHVDAAVEPPTGRRRKCKRPWLSASVLADGFVVPCCRVVDPADISFGRIGTGDFRSVWNSLAYQSFRAGLKSGDPPRACAGCLYYFRDPMTRDHI